MKRLVLSLFVVLTATSLSAQPSEGKSVELSISGAYQHLSSDNSSSGSGAFLLSPRLGIFVVEGLELEPEFVLLAAEGNDPMYMVNANISYNFRTHGKSTPFLLIGYGLANTVPAFGVPMFWSDFSIGVLNIGAGAKIFVTDDIAIRLEYRYQHFSGESDTQFFGSVPYTQSINAQMHTVQFGLCMLF